MRKRIIIIGIIIIVLMLIPFTVKASKNLIKHDDNGKPYIYGGEEVPEELKGKEGSIVVPLHPDNNEIEVQEEEELASGNMEEAFAELDARIAKIEETDRKFDEILFKYYGRDEIEKIKERMRNEGIHGDYGDVNSITFSPSCKELLWNAVNIYNTTSIQEEKNVIKEFCQDMVNCNRREIDDQKLIQAVDNME